MTKELILTGGEVALVDDEDYPLLSRHKWQLSHDDGYAVTTVQTRFGKNNTFYLHRFIIGGFCTCDHINLNKLDCRKENLRRATMQENGWNKGKQIRKDRPPTSNYKGVRYAPLKNKPRWLAFFKYVKPGAHKSTGKMIYLGYFDTEIEAAKAYNEAIVKYRGEWAWVNPLPNVNHGFATKG